MGKNERYIEKMSKYHNYIVKDLINDTDFKWNRMQRIEFPFFVDEDEPDDYIYPYPTSNSEFWTYPNSHSNRHSVKIFGSYIKERYGVREEEVKMFWKMFFTEIINRNY